MAGNTIPKPVQLRAGHHSRADIVPLGSVPTDLKRPPLPRRVGPDGEVMPWHPRTLRWWRDTWRSPMAPEFLEADVHGLFQLADVMDRVHRNPWGADPRLYAEIRHQRAAFGLTPIDRRRLQWEADRGEAATAERARRSRGVTVPDAPAGESPVDARLALVQ